jgi:hypothetical protein
MLVVLLLSCQKNMYDTFATAHIYDVASVIVITITISWFVQKPTVWAKLGFPDALTDICEECAITIPASPAGFVINTRSLGVHYHPSSGPPSTHPSALAPVVAIFALNLFDKNVLHPRLLLLFAKPKVNLRM